MTDVVAEEVVFVIGPSMTFIAPSTDTRKERANNTGSKLLEDMNCI